MKKRMTHLQWVALVLSLLIVFAPLCSFAVYADTTTSTTSSVTFPSLNTTTSTTRTTITTQTTTTSTTTSTQITTTTLSTTTTALQTTTTKAATTTTNPPTATSSTTTINPASTTTTSSTTTTTAAPPQIGSSLLITKNGEEVTYIGPTGISRVDVTVEITSDSNPSVYFDLSQVGGSANTPARVCSKSGTVWKCSLKDVNILTSTGSITIEVSASALGARAAQNITATLSLDNVGPSATFIGTDKVDAGTSYASTSKNTLVVKFAEAGAGLNNLDVFLDLTQFNGRSSARAENCTSSGDEWSCYWYNENAFGRQSGELLPIKVMAATKDDVGNAVAGITEGSAVLDRDAPALLSNISIMSIGASGETAYHQSADVLVINANVSDNTTKVSAAADLSRFYASGHTADPATCTLFGSGKYLCNWQTTPIKNGYFTSPITFNFSDFVGNSLITTQQVEVFATTAEQPNNFGLSVDYDNMLPAKGISRMTLGLMGNYLISVPFRLTGGSGAEVIRLAVDNCTVGNDTSLYTTYFQNQKSIPLARGITQAGELNRAEFYFGYNGGKFSSAQINGLASFNVKCSLSIFQKNGNIVYTVPEVESFTFPVTLRDSAIGGPPGIVVADKIQSMKDNWWTEQKWITSVYKILNTIEYWCQLSKSLVYMWQNLLTLEFLGKGMMNSNIVGVKQLGQVVYTIGCNLYEGFGTVVWAVWFGQKNPGGTKRCGIKPYVVPNQLPPPITTLKEALASNTQKFNLRYICGWATCEYAFAELSSLTGGNILNNLLSGNEIQLVKEAAGEGTKAAGGAAAGTANPATPATGSSPATPTQATPTDANYFLRRYFNIYPDDSLNPRNSIILSAASMCLPGVFYNLNKYRQINCRYILCLQNVTTAGGDLSVCDESQSQAWCLTLWGELFEIIGPARVLGVISQQVKNLFANAIPEGLDLIFKSTICTSGKGIGETKSWEELIFCDIGAAYYTFIDNYNRLKGMGSISFSNPDVEDACAKVFGNETDSGSSGTTTTTKAGGTSTITFGPATTTTTLVTT